MNASGRAERTILAQSLSWSRADAEYALKLALLVVRAGAKDSLGWWDDEALTQAGSLALSRLFPRNPGRTAIRLAFRAAQERHAGVLTTAGVTQSTTLLDLTGSLMESTALAPPTEPITSPDEFRTHLMTLVPKVKELTLPQPGASGLLDLTALAGHPNQSPLERATILAAGYLLAQKGNPVFPFTRLEAKGSP
ncbi:MAG: BrxE family protein [Deinococcus sp.]|nr:BrxE family protein [Deinococcus sp.]